MSTTNNNSLIKTSRENKNLTIAQLAAETKLSEQRIIDIENHLFAVGEAIPTYIKGQIRLICNVLEISSTEVVDEITKAGFIFFKEPSCNKQGEEAPATSIVSSILEAISSIKEKIFPSTK